MLRRIGSKFLGLTGGAGFWVWVLSTVRVCLRLWAMARANTPMVCAARPKERHYPAFRPPLSLIMEKVFSTGLRSFHHADGRAATLSDIAAATGASSRGTAHRHIQRLRTPAGDPQDKALVEEKLVASAKAAINSLAVLGSAAKRASYTNRDTTPRCAHQAAT